MKIFIRIFNAMIVFLSANMYILLILEGHRYLAVILAVCFVLINIMPSLHNRKRPSSRLRLCGDGCELLLIFLISTVLSSPESTRNFIAQKYNSALKKFGDSNPDFLAAINDLTASSCKKLNDTVLDIPGVFYQSIGSKLNIAAGGRFPLNFSYHLVKYFDGVNDGLVSADSFGWGKKKTFLTVKGNRGISHGDMIDLNRENIEEFDVREFYVDLINDLKERGF